MYWHFKMHKTPVAEDLLYFQKCAVPSNCLNLFQNYSLQFVTKWEFFRIKDDFVLVSGKSGLNKTRSLLLIN